MSSPARSTVAEPHERRELVRYLAVLVAREPGAWLEVRARRAAGGMTQRFYPTQALGAAADELLALARRSDVYVGCLPRRRRAGSHDALAHGWVLWADCDDPAAVAALEAFRPRPAIVVRSGTNSNVHAYWPLLRPVDPATIAAANRRLAHALGADLRSSEPARILRPPATWSFKHDPPTAVVAERFKPARRYRLEQILDALGDQPVAPAARTATSRRGEDALLTIAPAEYVQALTGLRVGRDGKVPCPFHTLSVGGRRGGLVSPARSVEDASSTDRGSSDPLLLVPAPVYFERLTGLRVGPSGKLHCLFHDDRSPSLHVYPEPGRGWFCFGCRRGGSVYDLAALLLGRETRGRDFCELRRVLEDLLL